jgi:DNA repair protein RadC
MGTTSHTASRTRPGTRVWLEGPGALSDRDLLALVLSRGSLRRSADTLAAELLESVGGLEGLHTAGPGLVASLPGFGPRAALKVAACVELGRRMQRLSAAVRHEFASPASVAACFAPRIGGLDHEQMWVLSLDGRNRLRGARRVAQGGRNGLAVTAREILGAALRDGALGFVLVHNHPSGSPEPSSADIEMTRSVERAAATVGVPLLDHVIVTASGDYRSLLEEGVMDASGVS